MNPYSNGAGKGDNPRPVNKEKYDANFDLIDWGKNDESGKSNGK